MEEAVQLSILGGGLAVWYLKAVRRIPGLLYEQLSKSDHLSIIVQGLCQINHLIRSILLVAVLARSQESHEGVL